MRKVLDEIRNTKGYISIEVVIVAGMILALGSTQITTIFNASGDVSERSISYVNDVQDQPIYNYVGK